MGIQRLQAVASPATYISGSIQSFLHREGSPCADEETDARDSAAVTPAFYLVLDVPFLAAIGGGTGGGWQRIEAPIGSMTWCNFGPVTSPFGLWCLLAY